jgi:hypothetical protein
MSVNIAVAVSCCVIPAATLGAGGVIEIVLIVGAGFSASSPHAVNATDNHPAIRRTLGTCIAHVSQNARRESSPFFDL